MRLVSARLSNDYGNDPTLAGKRYEGLLAFMMEQSRVNRMLPSVDNAQYPSVTSWNAQSKSHATVVWKPPVVCFDASF